MSNKIFKEQILHIAKLAKLSISDDEVERYLSEFNSILDYIGQIDKCDVSDIPDEHNLENFIGDVLQDDEVITYDLTNESALQNATDGRTRAGYVRSSKMID